MGRALAEGFGAHGHEVVIGTRDVDVLMARTEPDPMGNPPFSTWHDVNGTVSVAAFADAGAHAELLVNATSGAGSLDALRAAGAGEVDARIIVDPANPLDYSAGSPSLFVAVSDSMGERIQRSFPAARVVKAWNTMTARLMTNPSLVGEGDHSIPICGDDEDAKRDVTALLRDFGWRDIVDLGDITAARAMESYVLMWLRLYQSAGTPLVTTKIVR